MSRSGYEDDCENWQLICWRGAVASATRGARGQTMLRELASALDAMPNKRLIADKLEANGEVCALGCLGRSKGLDMATIDPHEPSQVSKAFSIAPALVQEIVYVNDEWAGEKMTPEQRWTMVRKWVGEQIKPEPTKGGGE